MGEDQDVPVGGAGPLHDLVGAVRQLGQGLAVRDAVAPDEPVGLPLLDLGRREPFVRPVVPLHQGVPGLGPVAEAGEGAGLARPDQGAGAHLRAGQAPPGVAVQALAEQLRAAPPLFEQGYVGPAGVPAEERPLGLAVPGEQDARCHGKALQRFAVRTCSFHHHPPESGATRGQPPGAARRPLPRAVRPTGASLTGGGPCRCASHAGGPSCR